MARKKTIRSYGSEIAAAVHEMVEGFHDAGLLNKETMDEFDKLAETQLEEESSPR
jgi:DNA-binding transcriptional regulator YiaG